MEPAVRVVLRRGPAALPGRLAGPALLAPADRAGLRRGPGELPGRRARLVRPVVEPVRAERAAPAERLDREAQQWAALPARVPFQEGLAPLDLGSPPPAPLVAELVRQEAAAREAAG